MGKEVVLFKSEEKRSRSDVGAFLHELADKFTAGQVVLRQGSDEITLVMPTNLILEIQVEDEDKKRKGIQHSLEVEIKWFDGKMHDKAFLVDGEFLVVGSQNFHYSAWGAPSLTEYNISTEDSNAISDFSSEFEFQWDQGTIVDE